MNNDMNVPESNMLMKTLKIMENEGEVKIISL